jgi:hypothetical protein
LLWSEKLTFEDIASTISTRVATDRQGNVFISGGGSSGTAWVAKYSRGGKLLWISRIRPTSDFGVISNSVVTDNEGNVVLSLIFGGTTASAGVAKFSAEGKLLWKKRLYGAYIDSAESSDVATDRYGNVFLTGIGPLEVFGDESDLLYGWIIKYNSSGRLLWKKKLEKASEAYSSYGVTTDRQGNALISGDVIRYGAKRKYDAFVAKYNPDGVLVWIRQFGSSKDDYATSIATNRRGDVYISGLTLGALRWSNKGESDFFVARYSSTGKWLGVRQDGTNKDDFANDVDTYGDDYVVVAGVTFGNFASD